jgi:hypothetical protein
MPEVLAISLAVLIYALVAWVSLCVFVGVYNAFSKEMRKARNTRVLAVNMDAGRILGTLRRLKKYLETTLEEHDLGTPVDSGDMRHAIELAQDAITAMEGGAVGEPT